MTTVDKTLKKLTIKVLAGSENGRYNLTPSAVKLTFIYGTAATGLTDFELALGDIEVGDKVVLEYAGSELQQRSGVLFSRLRQALALYILPEMLFLHCELEECCQPSPREIVQAMAESVGHGGCSGDCDCGCS